MNYKEDVLEIRKQRGVSVAKLAEITQIPVDRLYKWESGVGNPKAEDSQKIRDWLNNAEIVQEKPPGDKDKTIYNLSEANIILARATLILAEKINSGTPVKVSPPGNRVGKGNSSGIADLKLSGKRK